MSTVKTKTAEIHPTVLRLEPELRATLVKLAEGNGRSLSKEIAMRLQASLEARPDLEIRDSSGVRTILEMKSGGGKTLAGAAFPALDINQMVGNREFEEGFSRLCHDLPLEKKIALFYLLR